MTRLRVGTPRERGMALYVTLLALLVFAALTIGMITMSMSTKKDHDASFARTQRRYLAEAGVAAALVDLQAGGSGALGSANAPVSLTGGEYFTTVTDNGDGTYTVFATGTIGSGSRRLCAIIEENPVGVFAHSMFAGNDSGDDSYVLELGGTGSNADDIDGAVYSGGNLSLTGDAAVTGTLRAAGEVTGDTDDSGVDGAWQPLLDLAALDFPNNNSFNVNDLFTAAGSPSQMPEESPAHIFRLNPSNRTTENLSTVKDDYYLEDPYENFTSSNSTNANLASKITLSGFQNEPGEYSNEAVFYVDGNLWVHSYSTYGFAFKHMSNHAPKVTFVVTGNIYFSDNMMLVNKIKDGLGFVALRDDSVADSGNIYFGDPRFGTLLQLEAFTYAENNFYDLNLGTSSADDIILNGIMSAGNQIIIDRGAGDIRTRLELNYDSRVVDIELDLPGISDAPAPTTFIESFTVMSMFEVDAQ